MNRVEDISKNAKAASINALKLSENIKNEALMAISQALINNKDEILEANKLDLIQAEKLLNNNQISQSMYNRLKLDENKLRDMIQGVIDISKLEDPVNKILWEKEIAKGITLKKVSCPIGVIGVIFEARPDVISQISSLAVKSSNAVILKGGAEAINTNGKIFEIISDALTSVKDFPLNMVNLIYSREDVNEMLKADKYIDLIIPRGSNLLVKFIKENTKIPVLGHSDGVCHIFIDEYADIDKAIKICIDAKCQYPSACNSVETILIHKNIKDRVYDKLVDALQFAGVKINLNVENWHKEYGDKIVSIKIVDSIDEAINHINTYGSGHTDSIITENSENAERFMLYTDSSGVYQNISTRFADGFRYGFGAEVCISTNKTHARGPVGLEGLTIYKYKLYGNGDIVEDFTSGKRQFYK